MKRDKFKNIIHVIAKEEKFPDILRKVYDLSIETGEDVLLLFNEFEVIIDINSISQVPFEAFLIWAKELRETKGLNHET